MATEVGTKEISYGSVVVFKVESDLERVFGTRSFSFKWHHLSRSLLLTPFRYQVCSTWSHFLAVRYSFQDRERKHEACSAHEVFDYQKLPILTARSSCHEVNILRSGNLCQLQLRYVQLYTPATSGHNHITSKTLFRRPKPWSILSDPSQVVYRYRCKVMYVPKNLT